MGGATPSFAAVADIWHTPKLVSLLSPQCRTCGGGSGSGRRAEQRQQQQQALKHGKTPSASYVARAAASPSGKRSF